MNVRGDRQEAKCTTELKCIHVSMHVHLCASFIRVKPARLVINWSLVWWELVAAILPHASTCATSGAKSNASRKNAGSAGILETANTRNGPGTGSTRFDSPPPLSALLSFSRDWYRQPLSWSGEVSKYVARDILFWPRFVFWRLSNRRTTLRTTLYRLRE